MASPFFSAGAPAEASCWGLELDGKLWSQLQEFAGKNYKNQVVSWLDSLKPIHWDLMKQRVERCVSKVFTSPVIKRGSPDNPSSKSRFWWKKTMEKIVGFPASHGWLPEGKLLCCYGCIQIPTEQYIIYKMGNTTTWQSRKHTFEPEIETTQFSTPFCYPFSAPHWFSHSFGMLTGMPTGMPWE